MSPALVWKGRRPVHPCVGVLHGAWTYRWGRLPSSLPPMRPLQPLLGCPRKCTPSWGWWVLSLNNIGIPNNNWNTKLVCQNHDAPSDEVASKYQWIAIGATSTGYQWLTSFHTGRITLWRLWRSRISILGCTCWLKPLGRRLELLRHLFCWLHRLLLGSRLSYDPDSTRKKKVIKVD